MAIGIDVPTPPEPDNPEDYDYEKCPFYGQLSVRGQTREGTVVSTDMAKTVIVEREYDVFVPKYDRYMKRRSRIPAHVPGVLDSLEVGDEVKIAETRPLSKTKSHVVVENLTLRGWQYGVYWVGVEGYRGSHLTAYNNTEYGIYAFNSRYGRFEHSYASGCDDAGFYIGQSQPADAVITDCIAENNAMGYSGTNAGGNLVIRNSVWRHNMSGLVPNTLDSQDQAPQGNVAGGIRIENNEIYDNNNLNAPAYSLAYPPAGNGITVAGGTRNDIVGNAVRDQAKYGIAVTPIIDENFWRADGNAVVGNTVENSGRVDLALGAPAGDNRFADNEFDSSRPAAIERRDGSIGDPWVFLQMGKDFAQTSLGDYHSGETSDQPVPDPQPNMADPSEAPKQTIGGR